MSVDTSSFLVSRNRGGREGGVHGGRGRQTVIKMIVLSE